MLKAEPLPWWAPVFFVAFVAYWVWMIYVMLAPRHWVEWFLNKPSRMLGLQVSIVDERRLTRALRLYAALPFIVALVVLVVVFLLGG